MDTLSVIHLFFQISMWVTAHESRHVTTEVANSKEENVSYPMSCEETIKSNPFSSKKLHVNKWSRYNQWDCNGPQLVQYGSATFSGLYNGRQRDHILLFGGYFKLPTGIPSYRNETWIYTQQLNSWRLLDNLTEHPSHHQNPLLVSMCKQNIIMINYDKSVTNSWLFLGATFKWKKVFVVGQISPSPFDRVVSVKDNTSSCSCQEAFLFFPCSFYFGADWSLLYKIVCIKEATKYMWRQQRIQTSASAMTRFCMPVVTSISKETVYTIIENCLWYFSIHNFTWMSTTVCLKWKDSLPLDELLTAVYVEETMSYVLFSSTSKSVVVFNLLSSTSSSESVIGNVPWPKSILQLKPQRSVNVAVTRGRSIIVYTPGRQYYCGLRKWILQNPANTSVWVWEDIITTHESRSPPDVIAFDINYSVKNDKLYVLQNRDDYDSLNTWSQQTTDHLWSLNLLSMRWEVLAKSDEKLSNYTPKLANTWFHDNLWCVSDAVMGLWQYNSDVVYSWKKVVAHNSPRPVRIAYSLVTVNSSYMVVFGGRSYTMRLVLNDLWIFSGNEQNWKKIESDSEPYARPSPRYDHASVVVDSVMYVYGGSNTTQIDKARTCIDELWTFHVNSNKWVLVEAVNSGPNLTSIQPCKAYATSSKGQIWISVGCITAPMTECPHHSHIHIWTYIIHLNMWHRIGTYRWGVDIAAWGLETEALPILFWKGHLLMVGKSQLTLFYMKLGCPVGFASVDISRKPCSTCDIGSYAEEGSTTCRGCPDGITTASPGSGSILDCAICKTDYCQHGLCYITTLNSTPISGCNCDVGYTGSRCQYPTYYYVGFGIGSVILVTAAGLAAAIHLRRKRKLSEKTLRREIEKLNGVWQIDREEIDVLEEIGNGAAGSVWLARYRDITVAVKTMRAPDDPQMCLDFAREIKFMQTIRHRNIVLFLGAGKAGLNAQPFLVVEYMTRGSLRQVLDDPAIELTATRKLQFAVDFAQGMRFLHNLDPPRIHRDLKSENLLVSESWIVKVADFGLGRSYFRNPRSQTKRSRSRVNVSGLRTPLLAASEEMSLDGIGTARWCAPELSRRQRYDGSVDVYSCGIVLWEIWTRVLPFRDYKFPSAIASAIERGERPEIPANCPTRLGNLMRRCWHEDRRSRPSFNEIVQTLRTSFKT